MRPLALLLLGAALVLGRAPAARADAPAAPVGKLVFAHYLPFFARSINNKPAAIDSYAANLLLPSGDNGKWLGNGGFVRSRPLPPPLLPNPAPDWKQLDMQLEVRDAMSRGIDGFTFDYGPAALAPESPLRTMLRAARAISPTFKIALMPDMNQFGGRNAAKAAGVYDLVANLAADPALLHLPDGRLVLIPWAADVQPADWWAEMIRRWQADGIAVAFMPLFVGMTAAKADAFAAISAGFADWDAHEVSDAAAETDKIRIAHRLGKIYMQAVVPQDYRPKAFRYWETGNTAAFRAGWNSAIGGGADWVQLVTWNDYSESTQVEPSTNPEGDEENGFFDLTSYYASWFKTGRPPRIACDVLYYAFRRERTDAPAPAQTRPTALGPFAKDPPDNEIEALAFLTAPATLSIGVGANRFERKAAAGITSFKVPLSPGRPRFQVSRDGRAVIDVTAHAAIVPQLADGTLDLTYRSGSATAGRQCSPAIR